MAAKKIKKPQTPHERVLAVLKKVQIQQNSGNPPLNGMRVVVADDLAWIAYASEAKKGEVPKKLGIVMRYRPPGTGLGDVFSEVSLRRDMHGEFYSISANGPDPTTEGQSYTLAVLQTTLQVLEELGVITSDEREAFYREEEDRFTASQHTEELKDAVDLLRANDYTVMTPSEAKNAGHNSP